MAITSRSELRELFFQEAQSYIPKIHQKLAVLCTNNSDLSALRELHRLFHNIRGASSQVQLTLLSKGARRIELFVNDLLEANSPISANNLVAVDKITELVSDYVNRNNTDADGERILFDQMAEVFVENSKVADENGIDTVGMSGAAKATADKRDEWFSLVRPILPLLQELGECLTIDERDNDHNKLVYCKIANAISILVASGETAGMSHQFQLVQEFHLLLERLAVKDVSHHLEIPELVQDFLRYLEIVFSLPDPENNAITVRVKKQLQRFYILLFDQHGYEDSKDKEYKEQDKVDDEPDTAFLHESIAEDESVAFLDNIDGMEIFTEVDDSFADEISLSSDLLTEAAEDEIDDDQQLLMEIFQSECDEHLIVVNQSLNSLENDVRETQPLSPELRETVNTMRRAIHTLKGAAGMVGVSLLARGAHKLEDMLDWLYDESEYISADDVLVLAAGIDVIEKLSLTPEAEESEHLQRLVSTIDEYLEAGAGRVPEASVQTDETNGADDFVPESVEAEVLETAHEEFDGEDNDQDLPGLTGTLRVRLDDLDELVSIEGELVVARGTMEKVVDEFGETLAALDTVKENLRRKSQELEAGFEVQSLYGVNPVSAGRSDALQEGELDEFDPIELDRYSQLNLIIRSLNEISVDVNAISTTMTSLVSEIRGQVAKQQLTMRLMQDKLMRIRMTPMSSISRILFRTVRETGRKLEKSVSLTVSGEDVYMDRFVWAKITDPLMHILRNAVDHGIEFADVRAAAGKPAVGEIHLEADQRSRYVVLRVSDDGNGVQLSAVREKLKNEKLVENPDLLSEQELLDYLFHPSFSTRQDVSTISGRGVGLDVVKRNVEELKGSVEIINTPGHGVTFEFHIPFTLSVNRAILVSVSGKQFAVPLQDIHHVGHFGQKEILFEDGLSIKYEDDSVSVTNLGYYLQLEDKVDTVSPEQNGMLVLLFYRKEKLTGVAVDAVVEQREIIIKNLGSHLLHVPGISGVTVTGTGELIPILNLRELVAERRSISAKEVVVKSQVPVDTPFKVLIVDDSISVRHSVARLIENQSWLQQQAVDGMDALAKLEVFDPDAIILDIEMPKMNGYEFKSNINNHPLWKDIPIIMLTSRASEKHQQKARELGIDLYITKPYQETAFVQMLEDIRTH